MVSFEAREVKDDQVLTLAVPALGLAAPRADRILVEGPFRRIHSKQPKQRPPDRGWDHGRLAEGIGTARSRACHLALDACMR